MMNNVDLSKVILYRILAVNKIFREPKKKYSKFNRTTFALALKLEGKTVYTCDGKDYYSDANHLIVISDHSKYTFNNIQKGRCIMVEFEADMNCAQFDFFSIPLSENIATKVLKKFIAISEEWENKKPNYLLKCKADFYNILHLSVMEQESEYIPTSTKNILSNALNYIHTHYDDINITNDSLAELSNVSTVYFRKLFTKTYGMPPIKYLRKIRIKKAKELLLADSVSISDIATATGFVNVSGLSKVFKAECGLAPSKYVRQVYQRKV